MQTSSVQILLVEDFKPYRSLVATLLSVNRNSDLVHEAEDGLEAVEKAQQLRPDIILMDIGLPRLGGLDAARRIRELVPSSKIVFLSHETTAEVVKEAMSLGAWGYVSKEQAQTDLLAALTAVLEGHRFVSNGLVDNEFAPTT